MLDDDALAEVEGDAALLYRIHNFDPDRPPNVPKLVHAMTDAWPEFADMRMEAERCVLRGVVRIFVRRRTPMRRARWLWLHEACEDLYAKRGFMPGAEIEWRCNALAAALVAPRPAFLAAVRSKGHRVHELADAFRTPQALSLLRVGEVTGRPVVLLRDTPIVRGLPYAWPPTLAGLRRAVREPRPDVHAIRVDGAWGLMASLAA